MKKLLLCVVLLINSLVSNSQSQITNISQICDSLEIYPCSQGPNYIDQGTNAGGLIAQVELYNNSTILYTYNPHWLVTNLNGDTLFEDYQLTPFITIPTILDTIIISLIIECVPSMGEPIVCTISDTLHYNNVGMWVNPIPNSLTTINEYNVVVKKDNIIFDILGRPIKDYRLIPNGSIYILNNKKYIKLN